MLASPPVTMNPWVPAPLATAGAIEALTDWNRLHGSAHEHLCHRHVRLNHGRPTGCAHFVFGSGVIQVEQVQGWQVEYGQALEVLAGARARARASMYAFAHAPTLKHVPLPLRSSRPPGTPNLRILSC